MAGSLLMRSLSAPSPGTTPSHTDSPLPEINLRAEVESLLQKTSSSFEVDDLPSLVEEVKRVLKLSSEQADSESNTDFETLSHLLSALKLKQISVSLYDRQSPTKLSSPFLAVSEQLQRGHRFLPVNSPLGEGRFGIVHKIRIGSAELAEKTVIPGHDTPFHNPEKLEREGALLVALSHRNIIAITGFRPMPSPALILELADAGSLYDNMRYRSFYNHKTILHILTGITRGLAYIHKQDLVHGDMHWGNIGLCKGDNELLEPKLLDFELASLRNAESATEGNLLIQSPEALRRDDKLHHHACKNLRHNPSVSHVSTLFGKKCYFYRNLTSATDIWSFGMITFSLLIGDSIHSLLHIQRRNFLLRTIRFAELSYLQNALKHPRRYALGLPPKDPLCTRLLELVAHPCFARNSLDRPSADDLCSALSKLSSDDQ